VPYKVLPNFTESLPGTVCFRVYLNAGKTKTMLIDARYLSMGDWLANNSIKGSTGTTIQFQNGRLIKQDM
jgi:hypothetical protein